MFERLLASRYIRTQKRHSILTICSIAIAMALMTILFTALSTYRGIERGIAYDAAPYHAKIYDLTPEEWEALSSCGDFSELHRFTEPDGSIAAELMFGKYHENQGEFLNSLLPGKEIYDGLSYNDEIIDYNADLVRLDLVDLNGRARAVQTIALFYVYVIFLVLALRMIIDTAFEVSSKERERQFGVLQSVGATPRQIVRIISLEGLTLSAVGIPAGLLLGLLLSFAAFKAILSSGIAEVFFSPDKAAKLLHLHISPLLLILAAVTGLVWVLLSAYGTGMRVVRMSPIEAITGKNARVRRVRRHTLFGLLFGWKGKLASRNNRRQPKRFIITVVSLTLSVTLFSSFSVVLDEVQTTYDDAIRSNGLDYDMELIVHGSPEDPHALQNGLTLLRDSGYFEIHEAVDSVFLSSADESITGHCLILYEAPECYDRAFEGGAPMSYDELTQSGGYILMQPAYDNGTYADSLGGSGSVALTYRYGRVVSDEEYDAMTDAQRENVLEKTGTDDETGEVSTVRYVKESKDIELSIVAEAEERRYAEEWGNADWYTEEGTSSDLVYLVSTLDAYNDTEYANFPSDVSTYLSGDHYISVNLRDFDAHHKALSFIDAHSDIVSVDMDLYDMQLQVRTVIAAVRIGCTFLSVLIALIAIVNLVNILSTGILNRKSELAAMQCLGMTRGQLCGMTVIECLQYALTACIVSLLLSEAILMLTSMMLRYMELSEQMSFVQYAAPVPKILISSAAAFLAALAASFLPLWQMQKESLTEQIRSVE
ncbi:MAG: ABC transporter permease [Oscillospiraceae bacterium]|nr:ABC transporter permease [Oscillospiraceae bacterium]